MLDEISDICSHDLQQIWNDEILKNCQFPENLKLVDIHHFNIQSLALKIFKICNNMVPTTINDLFTRSCNSYNLRSKTNFVVQGVHTARNG